MVQLLIVDDEPLVQIGIRSMLNWESMGIEIAGTATNGRQAYDIILEKHPEIVITDIKMPIMDGMQLIEKCQSQEHPPLFILLTSYEEFALVKQAISYQVLDYLVKLELTEDVLNAAIQKALGILEKERKQAAIPETGSDLSLLQDNFYIRLLLNLFETEEQFATQCDLLSVRFTAAGYTVAYLEMQNTRQSASAVASSDITLYRSSYQMIRNLIVKYVPCRILFLDTTHLAIIFSLTKEQTGSYHQLLTDALTQTGDMLYNYYSIRILASVGSLVENPRICPPPTRTPDRFSRTSARVILPLSLPTRTIPPARSTTSSTLPSLRMSCRKRSTNTIRKHSPQSSTTSLTCFPMIRDITPRPYPPRATCCT